MRGLLLSSVALAVMTAASVAADLPARAPAMAPAPMYATPIFTWSGFYVGLNAGAAFNTGNRSRVEAVPLAGATPAEVTFANNFNTAAGALAQGDDNRTRLTGGVQLGYNWQFGAMVIGIEGDINAMGRGRRDDGVLVRNLNNTVFGLAPVNNLAVDYSGTGRSGSYFGTIRPRIGFAFDRTLIYATGGLAYAKSGGGNGDVVAFVDTNNNGLLDGLESSRTWTGSRRGGSNWGWTLGAGVEHAFSNNLSLKLEYLYVDLDRGGNRDLLGATVAGPNRNDFVAFRGGRSEDNFHVARVGLNYKFGGGRSSGPVVAAY